ncbi:MAG: hypothetical protein F6K47_19585, partial [Symploca sp. SIO2E6]|nr:hypothetical protein [Symploca sp. SIO2E6]
MSVSTHYSLLITHYSLLIAVVTLAHLQAQATLQTPETRLQWKLRLVKGLYNRGYSKKDILELFRFIDW